MAAAKPPAESADLAAANPPAESADMNTPKTAPTHATPKPTPSVTASSPAPRHRHVSRRSGQCCRNGKDYELVQRSLRASPRHRSRSRRRGSNWEGSGANRCSSLRQARALSQPGQPPRELHR